MSTCWAILTHLAPRLSGSCRTVPGTSQGKRHVKMQELSKKSRPVPQSILACFPPNFLEA